MVSMVTIQYTQETKMFSKQMFPGVKTKTTTMAPLLHRSASTDLISKKAESNVYETVAGILMEIENQALPVRFKPKQELKNFGRINMTRIREIQRLCRLADDANKTLPVKLQHASQNKMYRDIPSRLSEYIKMTPRSNLNSACNKRKDGETSLTFEYSCPTSKLNIPTLQMEARQSTRSLKCQQHIPELATGNQHQELPQLNPRQCGKPKASVQSYTSTSANFPKQTDLRNHINTNGLMKSKISTSNSNDKKTNLSLPANYKLGGLPLYLQKRQKQWLEDEERQKLEIRDASIPTGHELLPEEERTKTLEKLKNNYNDVLKQMSKLPIGMDTFRLQQQKESLEIRLVQIEEGIKIFSQPKVFIKKTT